MEGWIRQMTKSQIIESVASKTGFKKKDAESAVNAFIQTLEETLVQGEKIQIVGFGTFEVKQRAERIGRNPQTKEAIKIPASKHLSFTAGKTIKEAINK